MAQVYTVNSKRNTGFFSSIKINVLLIIINIIAFILFTLLISFKVIPIDDIAIKPANILQGKYLWTILTSMFMHAGFFHIFANMFSLFFVGSLVERLLGAKRYLYFYLASGIFASLLFIVSSFIFPLEYDTFAVGASGAIFGLIGLLMIIVPNLPVYVMFIPIPIKMKYAAPGMLVMLWIISLAGNVPIGNTAHLGGFLVGIFYGIYLRNKYKNKTKMISRYFS
jgi:membrane associated rhomboid family serine protease